MSESEIEIESDRTPTNDDEIECFVCSFIFLVTETITNLLITCLWSESKPFRKERRAEKKRERENQY